jgi:hypothetical protein
MIQLLSQSFKGTVDKSFTDKGYRRTDRGYMDHLMNLYYF